MKKITVVLAVLLLLAFAQMGQAADLQVRQYAVTDLGTLGGHSYARDVNDRGQVVGESGLVPGSYNNVHAFLWDAGVMHDLDTRGSYDSCANAINNNGVVVGRWTLPMDADGHILSHGFCYADGRMQDLGAIGVGSSKAKDINDAGQIVGWCAGNDYTERVFVYDAPTGSAIVQPYPNMYGEAINANGIIPTVRKVDALHATMYESGELQRSDTGWVYSVYGTSDWMGTTERRAYGINAAGDVVGIFCYSGWPSYIYHAYLQKGSEVVDLASLDGSDYTFAMDINDSGLVVGESSGKAVLWQDGAIQDLNSLIPADSGWLLVEATAVNNHGQIVGVGSHNGLDRAFLLTLVPEPCSITVLGLGLSCLVLRRRMASTKANNFWRRII